MIVNVVKNIIISIYETFFPRRCLFCDKILKESERMICNKCHHLYHYPNTKDNVDTFITLNGLVKDIYILSVYSYTEKAIKRFKFQSEVYNGIFMANMLANDLKNVPWIKCIDIIVYVPLHRKREISRGYNQAKIIADILGKKLNIPVSKRKMLRTINSKPQTETPYSQRFVNVKDIFYVKDKQYFENKNILLVDDVITTGTTMKYCIKAFEQVKNVRFYCTSLASNNFFA